MDAISIKNLNVKYDQNLVLEDINLDIPQGKLVAIIGPNGAGKTTLLKAMLNLICYDGEVCFNLFKERKNKIAYVPQTNTVDWDFPTTVLDVVLMGRYGHIGWFKRPSLEDKKMCLEMLYKVGMEDYCNRQINKLSGGQQQRVFLARALVQGADIYLLDEPFKGVDVQTEMIIVDLLKQLQKQGKTVMVVHHDLSTVKKYFNYVLMMKKKLICSGCLEEAFNEENLNVTFGNKFDQYV